ncbi:DnaB-like helicase N-terminal domain-containing protein [Caballeronia sp. ATUFL_M1_KS5A]|uniref:DnaB-like helicase N-terminal domain-containing protein n=1 Tax=Caballeronia sp. ATUFL_M1_KS5A TaxID=2921778 RepID=UPI0020287389|nr:DnaB-like helicase N-terminal domain-containing protein [Caballeronia sp. ATUFL_M1_KS5A]
MNFEGDRFSKAEQRVIACLLQDTRALMHCPNLVPNDFRHGLHGSIFATIRALVKDGMPVNVPSVHVHLCKWWRLTDAGIAAYLQALDNMKVRPLREAGYFAAIMRDGKWS